MIAQVYSVPGQTKGRRKAFLEWKSIDLSYKLSLTCGCNVNYYKSIHHPIPTCGNREHPGNFQNKSVSSLFSRVSTYILYFDKLKGRGRPFLKGEEGGHIVRLASIALGFHKRWKMLTFCEIWNNPTPPLFFIRHPNKKALQDMESDDKFVNRFQDVPKVKNPAVSKAKG